MTSVPLASFSSWGHPEGSRSREAATGAGIRFLPAAALAAADDNKIRGRRPRYKETPSEARV